MKKILFMMGSYLPNPSANGICVHEIIKELYDKGHEVHVITTNLHNNPAEEETGFAKVYRINDDELIKKIRNEVGFSRNLAVRFNQLLAFVKTILSYNVSRKRVLEFNKKAKYVIENSDIDLVVSVVRPIETMFIIPKLKKGFKNKQFALYLLDIPNEKKFNFKFVNSLWQRRTQQLYMKAFSKCDAIFTMESTKPYFNQELYKVFDEKIKYVDIPLFQLYNDDLQQSIYNKDTNNIVFTGSLSEEIRNPEPILFIFSRLDRSKINFTLHFYGSGCEEILKKYKKELGDSLIIHGKVALNEAHIAINSADILLNISNKTDYQVPSKIFEYFSTGKPIINYTFNEKDPAKVYYEKYDNLFNINSWESGLNYNSLGNFITNNLKSLRNDELREIYKKNTPEFLVNYLEKL